MRRLIAGLSFLLVLVALSFRTVRVRAYGTDTHATLSLAAYVAALNILTNFFQALGVDEQTVFTVSSSSNSESYSGVSWLVQGSIREDEEALPNQPLLVGVLQSIQKIKSFRPMFHFFDPVYKSGLSGVVLHFPEADGGGPIVSFTATTPSWVWAFTGFGGTTYCLLQSCGKQLNATNTFGYSGASPAIGARTYYLNGLTQQTEAERDQAFGLMFRSLGQVIHLLQDAAQPQHVRNDPHTDWPDWGNPSVYEKYVDANYSNKPIQGTYNPPAFALPQDFFANGSGQGMAEFTNSNFISAGTNCTSAIVGTCNSYSIDGKYAKPVINTTTVIPFVMLAFGGDTRKCEIAEASLLSAFPDLCTTDAVAFLGSDVHDSYTSTDTQNNVMSTSSVFDQDLMASGYGPVFSLNDFNYAEQAALLLPRAVGYSAGLLNYFFRGSMTANGGPSGFTITNTSSDSMNGTFSLYYDDANGNRTQVASWSAMSLASGAASSSLTFTAPTSPAPGNPGTYILVFQGQLGKESGAVVGTKVQLASSPNLCPQAAVCGQLTDSTGTVKLPGFPVQLGSSTATQIATTTTDASGDYAFTSLSAGTYSVAPLVGIGESSKPLLAPATPGGSPVNFVILGVPATVTVTSSPGNLVLLTNVEWNQSDPPPFPPPSGVVAYDTTTDYSGTAVLNPSAGQYWLTCWTYTPTGFTKTSNLQLPTLKALQTFSTPCPP